jgi:hypothetical protein
MLRLILQRFMLLASFSVAACLNFLGKRTRWALQHYTRHLSCI